MKLSSFRLCCLLFSASATFIQGAEFKFPDQTFTLPDGFEIELIAGPPLIDRPITCDFDEQGRLYVTDSSGSNDKVQDQLEKKPHRILCLEDTDDDGRFDKKTVFADKIMFPEGTMWLNGSLYVSAAPSIWKFTDADGDGVAEKREEWFQGKTLTGCANDLHGPYAGPDGRIYWCKGAFAEQTYERPGKKPFITRAGHVFRTRPDGSGIEHVMTGGMDNPVDVAFTRSGERILSCTFLQVPAAGRRDGLLHIIYGGVYGKIHDVINGHAHTGEIMPVLSHFGPAAACGLTRYESAAFGSDYRDNLFTTCFNLHKVIRTALTPDGPTFKPQDSDFLVSDNVDFHPTDVIEDADGSLIVLDTGGWYKICCPTSQLSKPDVLGAIYRIRRSKTPKIEDPRGLKIAWDKSKATELGKRLSDQRIAVQKRAMDELGKKGESAVPQLTGILKKSSSIDAKVNAIWTLSRIETAEAREGVRLALNDKDQTVQQVALHSVSLHRDAAALPKILKLLQSNSPAVQRVAAEAAGRIGDKKAVPALLAAASVQQARALEHSLIYALIEIADRDGTLKGLSSTNPFTCKAALIALDQMDGGDLKAEQAVPLLSSSEPALKTAASWVTDHHPEWSAALAGFFREKLAADIPNAAERNELQRELSQLSSDPTMQEFIVSKLAASDTPSAKKVLLLNAMAHAPIQKTPDAWAAALQQSLTTTDETIQRAAVTAIRSLPALKTPAGDYGPSLLKIASTTDKQADLRLDSLSAIPGTLKNLPPDLFEFLRTQMDSTQPPLRRSAAATVLGRSRLSDEQLSTLADTIKASGPMEVSKLLSAFENITNATISLKLIASLKESKGLNGLRAETLKPFLAKLPEPAQREGEHLLDALNVDLAKRKTRLEELQTSLPKGDIRRGQTLFQSQKTACSSCHAIGYLGGKVGPDLTRVGQIRTERDLLEAVVFPSASFVRSFEPMVIVMKDGEDYSGVIRDETPESIHLVSGPNSEQNIPRSNVVEVRPGALSIMPEGLDQQMSKQELSDLITFLKSLGAK